MFKEKDDKAKSDKKAPAKTLKEKRRVAIKHPSKRQN